MILYLIQVYRKTVFKQSIGGDLVRSLITLGIGQMEIDWGKNLTINNHAALFQRCDLKEIPCYYVNDDTDEPITKMKEGFSRKLRLVKPRLDLLGYDLTSIHIQFDELIRECEDHGGEVPLTFDLYYEALKTLDLSSASTIRYEVEGYENGYALGEYVVNCVLRIPEINRKLIGSPPDDRNHIIYDLAIFLENLDPYITLRILAENPENLDLDLQWNYSDALEGGWISQEDVFDDLNPTHRILIVTEGSSDSFVLKKTLKELYPEIADFFDFIDMKDNYPFTGTGSLYNFCVGLCRINVLNNIMVIFDNDTAGVEKYKQAASLKKPKSFLITKLPDHPDFCNMQTVGPQGNTTENINGTAVAIECFLDFNCVPNPPIVRWTEYRKNEKAYQGELEKKEIYVSKFKNASLIDSSYNISKLRYLVDFLIQQWINRNH